MHMKTVFVNDDGYLLSPYFKNCTIEIEVSNEQYDKMLSTPFNHNWRYVDGVFVLESFSSDKDLKERRERECFRIIDNRSPMWYSRLTTEQKSELDAWYQAWLDVTATKIIPVKPEWL